MAATSSDRYNRRDPHARISVDVGTDAPLMTSDTRLRVPDRRNVNIRWFAGTVLTGITSVTLMGGALFAAIDARHDVAQPTDALSGAIIGSAPLPSQVTSRSGLGSSSKGDRFRPTVEEKPARRIIQVSTVAREGNRDFIRVKPFIHVKAPLALKTSDLIANITEFNPLAVYTEEQPEARQEELPTISSANVDGEVSIQVRDFPLAMGAVDMSVQMADTEALEQIASIGQFLNGEDARTANLGANEPDGITIPAAIDLSATDTIEDKVDPFSITIVPENVSFLEKFEEPAQTFSYEERIIPVTEKDSLATLLVGENATQDEIASAVDAMVRSHGITQIRAGQTLRIAVATTEDGTNRLRPVRISLYDQANHVASVALNDEGRFIGAAQPYLQADLGAGEALREIPNTLPSLYDSLYETGLSQQMPKELVNDLIRIFSYDLDFQKSITPSDTISVLHSEPDPESNEPGHVLFAEITLAGNTKQFYRFRTSDDGYVDYYDASGRSAKKFLMRKPVASGRFNSPFGMRKHPITGVYKMHTGVDWSAPRGTPIYAAGDGTVRIAKWNGGYGRHVRIAHANRYETSYSHLTRFAPGIKAGTRVRQGQLIGYVGSTGFSTGPHLHYEVLVNKRHVDPMRIKLPRGRVLKGDMLAAFRDEKRRIDALLADDASDRVATATTN